MHEVVELVINNQSEDKVLTPQLVLVLLSVRRSNRALTVNSNLFSPCQAVTLEDFLPDSFSSSTPFVVEDLGLTVNCSTDKRLKSNPMISRLLSVALLFAGYLRLSTGFSIVPPSLATASRSSTSSATFSSTQLFMSDQQRVRTTKKGVSTITKDKTETKVEEQKNKEEMWRVVLHNDEVHTFNYVIRSLCKCIGTLDRKAAFEICVQTHGIGKATVTKTWKKQAEQFCLGLQRQGLTVSISPDEDFGGGHSGGGL